MRLGAPEWLPALIVLPIAAALLLWAGYARRRALHRLADPSVLPKVAPIPSRHRAAVRSVLIVVALAGVLIALLRPQWNPEEVEVVRRGRDVVFVVDVSRSMLAEDLAPNRLASVRRWLIDFVDELAGDRVGLVAFAGEAVIRCPLTLDYDFFRLTVEELDPSIVPFGGTNIGDAIRRAVNDVHTADEAGGGFRDIVLITDGEDQESLPVAAAAAAGADGIRLIAIGIGSDGTTIPTEDGVLTYAGETVRTALDEETLRRMAAATPGGAYLGVGIGTLDLPAVYRDLVRSVEQREMDSAKAVTWQEGFWIAALAAMLLLVLDPMIGGRHAT